MWGTQEMGVFASRLIADSREDARQGLLAAVNKVVRAIDASKRLNLSIREAYSLISDRVGQIEPTQHSAGHWQSAALNAA